MNQNPVEFTCFSFFALLSGLAAFLLLGQTARLFFTNVKSRSVGVLLFGLISFVVIVSIFYTKGQTTSIFYVLLFLIWFMVGERPFESILFTRQIPKRFFVGIPVLVYIVYWMLNINWEHFPFFYSGRDHVFYSAVSYFISDLGKETVLIDWVESSHLVGAMPYHYFELWLNTGIARIFGILHLHSFEFITIPILQSILIYVMFTLKPITVASFWWFLGVFSMALLSFQFGNVNVPFLFNQPKLIPVVIIMLCQLVLWKERSYLTLLILFILYVQINLTLLPFSMASFFILSIYLRTIKKINWRSFGLVSSLYLLFVALYIVFYIAFSGEVSFSAGGLDFKYLIQYYQEIINIKKGIHFLVLYVLQPFKSYWFVFLLGIPLFIKKQFWHRIGLSVVYFFVILIILGFGASLIHPYEESSQLVLNYLVPSCFVILFGLFLYSAKLRKAIFRVQLTILFLVTIGVYANRLFNQENEMVLGYTMDYVLDVKQKIESNTPSNKYVGRYIASNDIKYAYDLGNNVQPWGYYLFFMDDGWVIRTLNHEIVNYDFVRGMPEHSAINIPLINYIDFQKANILSGQLIYEEVYSNGALINRKNGKETFEIVDN